MTTPSKGGLYMQRKLLLVILVVLVSLAACMGPPVREAVKVDMSVPVGKIEDSQFVGIRYPFNVSAPPGWKITMKYPDFMVDLGYEKEGLEESQVFVFNPVTRSNLQVEFTPAGRHITFSQKSIEDLTDMAGGSLKEELEKDYGPRVSVMYGPTTPYSLKGVPYAAKKYVTYTVNGVRREQGWIYGFAEPYQIFILYMVVEKEGTASGAQDRDDLKKILGLFEVTSTK